MLDLRDPKTTQEARAASADFNSCVREIEVMLRASLKAFAQHHAADGKCTREQWAAWFEGETPSQEYIDGFNAGVESVLLSAETFLDEHTGR